MAKTKKNNAVRNALGDKIETVACYVRVSSTEQALHGLSLDAQQMKLTEYAEKNNMRIVEWYIDEGVSGRKKIKNRPELQRMIQDAEAGKFQRIIFIKLDRFFRSVAEYHECMKRIDPVVWSTTEEKYDLTTANGRFFVNAKLAIAEMEADQTGERIDLVNEYKVTTGQPLSGSMPFCYKIETDKETGRKKVVKNPDTAEIMYDLLEHFQTHQSIRGTVVYINEKYNLAFQYKTVATVLQNPLICGEYRGNPDYCKDPYIDRETFDRIQKMTKRNSKANTASREYIFSGLIKCEKCGRSLAGGTTGSKCKKRDKYKWYRCTQWRLNHTCTYNKAVAEITLERLMLANIERYFEEAKIKSAEIRDGDEFRIPQKNIDDINAEIDRLNYSWQTGKIRTVEQYEKQYAALTKKLEEAKASQHEVAPKDFGKIESILHAGWRSIYESLDDAHRRAFWRSFVESIEVDWTGKEKKITRVNFF